MSDPTPPGGYDPSGPSVPPGGQPPVDPDATIANPIVPPAGAQPGQPGQPGTYGQQPGQAGAYGQPGQPGQPGAQDPTAYGYAQGSPYGDVPPPADDGKRKGLVIAVVGLGIAVAVLLAGLLWALLRKSDEVATTATTAKVTSTTTSSTSTTSTTAPTTSTTTGGDSGGGGGNSGGNGGGGSGGGGGGGGQPSTTKAPTSTTTTAPAPQVTSISAPSTWTCGGGPYSPPNSQLTLNWNTSNAQSVTVAIDSPGGTYQSGLPANGSLQVPAPCAKGETQTYYVTAIGAGGAKSTKSTTTTGTGA